MSTYLKFLISAIILISCNSKSKVMTSKEFTKMYLDSLSTKFPTASFKIIDDSTIESHYGEMAIRISIDNAFNEYQHEPDSLKNILNRYITVSSELYSPKEKIKVDRIIPIIKPIEYLDEIRSVAEKMGGKKGVAGVYEKYNNELIIVYAEDTKNSIRYLTNDDIETLSLNVDSLRPIAVRNLDKILTNIQRKGGDGVFMLTAGGDYEASIILLNDILTKETLPVNGDFIIAIPTRDVLLITGSNDKAGIEKIRTAAKNTYETGNYKIIDYLFKWNGKIFEKYP